MGQRGPAPTPTKLLETRGSWRAKGRGNEPQPRRGRPRCPAWLDDIARAKWKALAPELDRLGLLTIIDGDALAAYCVAWSELEQATQTLAKEGRTCTAKNSGYTYPHPAVGMQRSALKLVKDFAALFGLNPATRGRLSLAPAPAEDDPDEERFFGRTIG